MAINSKPTTPTKPASKPTTRTRRTGAANTKVTASARANRAGSKADVGAAVGADTTVDLDRVRKPFYAYVGVADLAARTLRALPEAYTAGVTESVDAVKTLPIVVRGQLAAIPAKARDAYTDLADRGQKLVTSVLKSASTKAAVEQVKTARSQVKGAATSVRKAAAAGEKAAESAADKIG
jgi:hypothetical protein